LGIPLPLEGQEPASERSTGGLAGCCGSGRLGLGRLQDATRALSFITHYPEPLTRRQPPVIRHPSSVLCPLSSALRPLSSVVAEKAGAQTRGGLDLYIILREQMP